MYRLLLKQFLYGFYMVAAVFSYTGVSAQTVIGGDTIDQSAILDLQDTARGMLLSRLTTTQRNAIVRPAFGLLILNTTKKCLETNIGSPDMPNWKCLTTGIPVLSDADTMYWNRKLGTGDTLSLSNRINGKLTATDTVSLSNRINAKLSPTDTLSLSSRIDSKIGLPPSGNSIGDMLFWDGSSWVKLPTGQNGQMLQLINGLPTWAGAAFASLTTNTVTGITGSTATVGGNITSDGGGTITARGVVYGTTPSPVISHSILSIGSGTGAFSGTISGLSVNTTYYVRSFATNSAGTAYGNEVNFTTATVPAVVTSAISNISNNSASGGGNVTSDGGSPVTARGLVYGTSPSPTLSNSVLNIGTGSGSFSGTITGIFPNTTYYVRAFATNSAGTAYGNEQIFTTQSESSNNFRGGFAYVDNVDMAIEAQQWQYIAISKDNNNQAKVYKNGQLAYQGNFQNVNYIWDRLDLGAVFYTSYNQWFNGYIDGIRISNKVRTASEIENYFNSNLPLSSDANTIGLWNFDQTSGTTINASVGSYGTLINAVWNDQGKFGQCLSFNGTNARAAINQSIPTSNMTFEFWIKPNIAQQSWPISWYGLYTAGFGTGIRTQVPTITTSPISSITSNSAVSGGNITSDGGSPVTARGLVYGTSPSPTLSNSVLNVGSGTGSFAGTISGLSPNTTYYVRSFATNSAGTAYGNEVSFTNPCGAFVASGVWKNFMCHNLGAANTSADPFTPSWEINGGYWQWGRKEMVAAGPSGSGAGQANDGVVTGWTLVIPSSGSWSDVVKTDNDPCPEGYRLPTRTQWEGLIYNNVISNIGSSWESSSTNYTTGKLFGNSLFLPAAGARASPSNMPLFLRGSEGLYWSSSESSYFLSWHLSLRFSEATTYDHLGWPDGLSIRCIAE